jgi:hypothetical protein
MSETRLVLFGLWVALMLTYLLGDVLRIFAGHFTPGGINGVPITQAMGLGIAVIMFIPIAMSICALLVADPTSRWVHIVLAIGLALFNLVGLPGYEGLYDKLLIVLGIGINALTVWKALTWPA